MVQISKASSIRSIILETLVFEIKILIIQISILNIIMPQKVKSFYREKVFQIIIWKRLKRDLKVIIN